MSVNFFLRSLAVALLVTASASAVTTVWNGTVSSDWDTLGNWTSTLPVAADTVTINAVTTPAVPPVLASLAPATGTVTTAINSGGDLTINNGGRLNNGTMAINASGSVGGTVTVNSGGHLNVDSSSSSYWSAGVANIKGTAYLQRTTYVGSGGSASVPRLMTINITEGGSVSLGNQNTFIIGNNTTGSRGVINVWGANLSGTTSVLSFGNSNFTLGRSPGTGLIDLRNGGRLEYSSTQRTTILNGITAGTVVAGDARERLVEAFVPGSTTRYRLTTFVNDWAYNPVPASAGSNPDTMTLVSLGSVPVSWTAPLARDYSDTIECRLYNNFATGTYPVDVNGYPTDPNGDLLTSYTTITRPASMSTTMTSAVGGRYQWRVDCIDSSVDPLVDPNYPITTKGPVWYFKTGNAPPVANAGVTQLLGLVGGTTAFVSDASITDDGLPIGGSVTGQWTQLDGPSTVAGLPASVTAASPNVSLNITLAGRYRFQLIPYDTALYGTASIVQANVYSDSCLAAKAGTWTALQGDFNADCKVGPKDLALMVADWLRCTDAISGCN